ncbi:MAG: hypothetical protein QM487_15350 [Candidatus Marithrix sp.]
MKYILYNTTVLVLLSWFCSTANAFTNLDEELNFMVQDANRNLPRMMSGDIRADSIEVVEGNLYFYYTFVNYDSATVPYALTSFYQLIELQKPSVKTRFCNDINFQRVLKSGKYISTVYRDKNSATVYGPGLLITSSSCEEPPM